MCLCVTTQTCKGTITSVAYIVCLSTQKDEGWTDLGGQVKLVRTIGLCGETWLRHGMLWFQSTKTGH